MAKTTSLSEEEINDLRECFAGIDINQNGHIESCELSVLFREAGLSIPGYQLREIIKLHDKDKDGTITFDEFLELYKDQRALRDVGGTFKSVVSARKDINTIGGTSNASVEGTTHSVKDEETVAFADWINKKLEQDPDLVKYLPIDGQGTQLFQVIGDGIILCKLINTSVPGTIDERSINKTKLSIYRKHENLTLALNSATSIGCNIVNIGADDLETGKPHLVLGMLWQIIRIGLLSDINLAHHPGLIHLLEEGEELADLQKLSPEAILLRWVNYHLKNAGCNTRINNFSDDIKDSEAYTYLLHQIAPKDTGVELSPLGVSNLNQRAELMLQNADKIGCRSFVAPSDIVEGNAKLNLAFVANLFNNYPALEGVDDEVQMEAFEESREEKTYRNWMNSMGVNPYVHRLYSDLGDGLVILQLEDKIQPGCVNWNKVNKKFTSLQSKMRKIENCNHAVETAKKLKFSVVGIGGTDIHDGNQTLTLAILWQLMRAYTLTTLKQLGNSDKPIEDADIINWANEKLAGTAKLESFKDPSLSDGITMIRLMERMKPSAVDWNAVNMDAATDDEKLVNARYAISISRKIGARVYALPEDLVEVKPKMVLTIFACLMARDFQTKSA